MWVNRIRSGEFGIADFDAPCDLAAIAGFGFVGDAHALRAGLLAEAGDASRGVGFAFGAVGGLGFLQAADDGDFFAVDDDRRVAGEPAVGKPAGEPVGGVACVGLLGLLPAAGAAGPSAMEVMVSHDYMITPLQPWWNGFHPERNGQPCGEYVEARQLAAADLDEAIPQHVLDAAELVFRQAQGPGDRGTVSCRRARR